jgi:hypothetical protein
MDEPDLDGADPGHEGLEISFDTPVDGTGLVIRDKIEKHRFQLRTPDRVALEPADPDRFWFPADNAVQIQTARISVPHVAVCIRDQDGGMLAQLDPYTQREFSAGEYSLELCGPIKLYLRVESAVDVVPDPSRTVIEFSEPTSVLVGARSTHEQPAATITTTDDPRDVMVGLSAFGSALKTTSVERSYPSLRGHPPLLELGDELDVPAGLESPDTGVTLELPPEYRYLYVATPLAYYLGADIVAGETPRLVTDRGFEYGLDAVSGFERAVERVLKQTFLFDCLTRTEGLYKVDLHERDAVEPRLNFDFADLYGRSVAEQLETYLSVPYTAIRDYVPEWKLTTHVEPAAENAELLPFVTNDLSIVRTPGTSSTSSSDVQATAAGEFFRNAASAADAPPSPTVDASPASSFTRSTSTRGAAAEPSRSYVQPEASESLEQAWVGDGTPIGASKVSLQAYHNRLARSPTDGAIDITVVCNDSRMLRERDVVDEVYGSREELPFDVRTAHDLTVDELRTLLTEDTDFLHYIGHIDREGFECSDGKLDATTFESVGMDSFLLNACQSYEQGEALIAAGAIGGIVTLADVVNSGAVEVGKLLARLLNRGFSLRSALNIVHDESIIGNQYIVVGAGGLSITQSENGTPNICELRQTGEDRYDLRYKTYPTTRHGMGSLVLPRIAENTMYFLSSGVVQEFETTGEELEQFFSLETVPVKVANELVWSDELDI